MVLHLMKYNKILFLFLLERKNLEELTKAFVFVGNKG